MLKGCPMLHSTVQKWNSQRIPAKMLIVNSCAKLFGLSCENQIILLLDNPCIKDRKQFELPLSLFLQLKLQGLYL